MGQLKTDLGSGIITSLRYTTDLRKERYVMKLLNKKIEIDERITLCNEKFSQNLPEIYSRMNVYTTVGNKQKITWFYEGDEGLMKADKTLHHSLEFKYRQKFLMSGENEMICLKKLVDIEELIEYDNVQYLRVFSNWPKEKTKWFTKDEAAREFLEKQFEGEPETFKNLNLSVWTDVFADKDLPEIMEEEYQKMISHTRLLVVNY